MTSAPAEPPAPGEPLASLGARRDWQLIPQGRVRQGLGFYYGYTLMSYLVPVSRMPAGHSLHESQWIYSQGRADDRSPTFVAALWVPRVPSARRRGARAGSVRAARYVEAEERQLGVRLC